MGTKYLTKGDKKEAKDLFSKSYQLYNLFGGVNLGVLNVNDLKEIRGKAESKVSFLSDGEKKSLIAAGSDNFYSLFFEKQGTKWSGVNPKLVLGESFSGANGYRRVLAEVEPVQSGGGGCGV